VASPLYKQHYCFSDGRCMEEPGQRLRTWPVRMNGEQVEIGMI
jgi:nitrite reductase (NADH) small subunit